MIIEEWCAGKDIRLRTVLFGVVSLYFIVHALIDDSNASKLELPTKARG